MLFSILIANYNNGNYFSTCWQSIINQTYKNWEVIIVDDKSTDNSVQLIKQIVANDGRVKFLENDKNYGCGYTKKQCANLATGQVCAFLDPDDALELNALQMMIDAFEVDSELVLAYSKHHRCNTQLISMGNNYDLPIINTADAFYFNLGGVISHFTAFKTNAYKKTAGIDAYMLRAVDQDLYLKLCEQGPTKAINNYLYKYRIHANGISTGNDDSNVTKADYWHWYAINAAAKRRGIYIENLFTDKFVNKGSYTFLQKTQQLILNSGSYKLAQKISTIKNKFTKL